MVVQNALESISGYVNFPEDMPMHLSGVTLDPPLMMSN